MGDYVKSTYVKKRGNLAKLLAGVSKEVLAEAMVEEDLPQTCIDCDSRRIVTYEHDHRFPYGVGETAVTLFARIPVRKCEDCGNEWLDHHAEEIMQEAESEDNLMDQDLKTVGKAIFIVFCLCFFTVGPEKTFAFMAALGPVAGVIVCGAVWLLYLLVVKIRKSATTKRPRYPSIPSPPPPEPKNPYRNSDLR